MSACASVPARQTDTADLFVEVNGTALRYRDEGCGPAVLLVHGWTLDLEMWDPQVRALRDAFRVIRLDRRGHGFSGGIANPQCDGADLTALCEHLRLTPVALIGMSQGVRGVLEFAAGAPRGLRALILDGPPPLDAASESEVPLQRYAALARRQGIDAFRSEWSRHALMQLYTQDAEACARLAAMIARYPGNDLMDPPSPAELAGEHLRLESLRIPALVLSGEHDLPGRRQAAQQLAGRLPDAELAVIPGAGHLPNLDSPDTYSKICRGFLTRHCAGNTS
jgi:pimeloyl-ACP methyl ester carboxylesterase